MQPTKRETSVLCRTSSEVLRVKRPLPLKRETLRPRDTRSERFEVMAGDVVLSHRVSPAVPSALRGLTTVFGMGTGMALAL